MNLKYRIYIFFMILIFFSFSCFGYENINQPAFKLTKGELSNLGLINTSIDFTGTKSTGSYEIRGDYNAKDYPEVEINLYYEYNKVEDYNPKYFATLIDPKYKVTLNNNREIIYERHEVDGIRAPYFSEVHVQKIIGDMNCNSKYCYNKTKEGIKEIHISTEVYYNTSNVAKSLSVALLNMVTKKIKPITSLNFKVISPRDLEKITYIKNQPYYLDVKVETSNNPDSVEAYYEVNGIMLGGRINFNNNVGELNIKIDPDEIKPNAELKVYVRKNGKENEKTIHLSFVEKTNNHITSMPNFKKNSTKNNKNSVNNKIKNNPTIDNNSNNKQNNFNANNFSIRKGVNNKVTKKIDIKTQNIIKKILKIKNNQLIKFKDKVKKTEQSLSEIKKIMNGNSYKIDGIIKYSNNDNLVNKEINKIGVSKGSSTWFKLKYSLNKNVLGNIVDKISDHFPIIGKFKDYFKSNMEENLFNSDEEIKKTAKDLNVDQKSAKLYNQLSGIEDTEKGLSPAKNLVSIPVVGKGVEFAINALTQGTKSIVARYYKKEYNYVIKQAKYYRKHNMKWKDVHKAVIRDLDELKGGMSGLGAAEERTASQYLNTMSKGQYKNIDARAHLYILQAMENGDIK